MPILKNPKHEAFCAFRAGGKTLDESYRLAGYTPHRTNAARLMSKDHIKARIAELQVKVATIFEVTAELMYAQFEEDRRFAIACDNPAIAHQASVSQAKLFGLMTERQSVSVSHSYATMTDEELRFELAALNAEALALKPGSRH